MFPVGWLKNRVDDQGGWLKTAADNRVEWSKTVQQVRLVDMNAEVMTLGRKVKSNGSSRGFK